MTVDVCRLRRIGSTWIPLCLALLLLAGCASQTAALLRPGDAGLPPRVELESVPFHAQEEYQCGPAALAMALQFAGVAATPEMLSKKVFLPQRQGSLQAEMLAGARREGALATPIRPTLHALLEVVAAGTPVIVLQNLSLEWFPRWHYAVVVGYDLVRGELFLRSGENRRLTMSLSTFEHTWKRSKFWGMVAVQPDRIPSGIDEADAIAALVAFERVNSPSHARLAYESALERWPANATLWMGLGNVTYAAGDRIAAAAAFRRATEVQPESAPAYNNLASILMELGEFAAARLAAEKAISLGGAWRDAATATLREIDTAERRSRQ